MILVRFDFAPQPLGTFAYVTMQHQVMAAAHKNLTATLYRDISDQFRDQIILFGVIGLVVAILAPWFVASRFARPLVEITWAANQVASGDISGERLKVNSTDELGQLT